MRLVHLKPHWIQLDHWASPAPFYIGLSFLCPHCGKGPCPTCGQIQDYRLAVKFWPPIDPTNIMATFASPLPDNGSHRRQGDTFDTLTLTPSIGFDIPPHFHGTIINGEVTNSYSNSEWAKSLK